LVSQTILIFSRLYSNSGLTKRQTVYYIINQEVLTVNNNFKVISKESGMSIYELATRSKMSRFAITNIENGKSNPLASSIYYISSAIDKDVSEIFFDPSVNHELQREEVSQ